MFGRRKGPKGPTTLQRLVGEAQEALLAMPDEAARADALEAVRVIVAAVPRLYAVPERVWGQLWKALCLFVVKSQAPGADVPALLAEAAEGAPELLGLFGQGGAAAKLRGPAA